MTTGDRLVVVDCDLTMAYNERAGLYAARFRNLGLTSFGSTQAQAVARLKKQFNIFIHTHRDMGVLEKTLNDLGATWYWADQYPESAPPYENTNLIPSKDELVRKALEQVHWRPTTSAMAANNHMAAAA